MPEFFHATTTSAKMLTPSNTGQLLVSKFAPQRALRGPTRASKAISSNPWIKGELVFLSQSSAFESQSAPPSQANKLRSPSFPLATGQIRIIRVQDRRGHAESADGLSSVAGWEGTPPRALVISALDVSIEGARSKRIVLAHHNAYLPHVLTGASPFEPVTGALEMPAAAEGDQVDL